eukprot:TRINITY_DN17419_c0_g1_i1.p1 TRINITY_DN17419_c0_g1~~TRINITY_DN17419_c0_g1_i1.p1  ORF type:complete len:198 (+),score=49.17 TRINITY_DN17419_c0_g1_i1:120-713(+)
MESTSQFDMRAVIETVYSSPLYLCLIGAVAFVVTVLWFFDFFAVKFGKIKINKIKGGTLAVYCRKGSYSDSCKAFEQFEKLMGRKSGISFYFDDPSAVKPEELRMWAADYVGDDEEIPEGLKKVTMNDTVVYEMKFRVRTMLHYFIHHVFGVYPRIYTFAMKNGVVCDESCESPSIQICNETTTRYCVPLKKMGLKY